MRNSREVQPNLGFLQQLATYDNKLRQQRYRYRDTVTETQVQRYMYRNTAAEIQVQRYRYKDTGTYCRYRCRVIRLNQQRYWNRVMTLRSRGTGVE